MCMYFRKRVFTCSPCSPETGHDIGGYGGSSRKNARERNNERLAQRCARSGWWKARAKMRENGTMKGSRKNAREMPPEGTKSRHRMPGNGYTKETYERDGTETSVMRTRCERFWLSNQRKEIKLDNTVAAYASIAAIYPHKIDRISFYSSKKMPEHLHMSKICRTFASDFEF